MSPHPANALTGHDAPSSRSACLGRGSFGPDYRTFSAHHFPT